MLPDTLRPHPVDEHPHIVARLVHLVGVEPSPSSTSSSSANVEVSLHATAQSKALQNRNSLCVPLRPVSISRTHPALMPEDRRLLFAAALAHDIGASPRAVDAEPGNRPGTGLSTKRDNHGIVSCHLLRRAINEPHLPGLRQITDRDWSALLYCVFWHEGNPKVRLANVPLIEPWRTRPLAGMLRLSEGLACVHRNVVTDIRAPSWLRILVKSSRPCDQETAAAQRNSDVLSEALDLRIAVQQIVEEEDTPTEDAH